MINEGEILELYFYIPGVKEKYHPGIVVSNNNLNETEDSFYCVMLSSKAYNIEYIFDIKHDMLTKPISNLKGYAKTQILIRFEKKDIYRHLGCFKKEYLPKLKNKIIQSIF